MIRLGAFRKLAVGGGVAVLLVGALGGSCRRGASGTGATDGLPAPSTKQYGDALRAFYVGVSALEAGDTGRAQTQLTAASKLAPEEPAIWADLALLAMRAGQLDVAAQHVNKALSLAPNDPRIVYLSGTLKSRQGKFDEAAKEFQRVIELEPKNLRAQYELVDLAGRQGGPDSDAKVQKLLEQIVQASPDNMVVLLDLARVAAKQGDGKTLKDMVGRMAPLASKMPASAQEHYKELQAAAGGPDPRSATTRVMLLQNVLRPVHGYQADKREVQLPTGEIGEPLLRPVKLQAPSPTPAPTDMGLAFSEAPIAGVDKAVALQVVYLSDDPKPAVLALDGGTLRIAGATTALTVPGGSAANAPRPDSSVCVADLNADFRSDLVVSGPGGIALYEQSAQGAFSDVTVRAKLPAAIAKSPIGGVWAADIDLDGDLDLVVSPVSGTPGVLRNNGDGTFRSISPFAGAKPIVSFCWADVDRDGDPDAVLLESDGTLVFFADERSGQFTRRAMPETVGKVAALAILDANDDGILDIAALKPDGTVTRISDEGGGAAWTTAEIGKWSGATELKPGSARLIAEDLDNNGAIDLIASSPASSLLLLHEGVGVFKPLASPLAGGISGAVDMSGAGRLDLFGITTDGKPFMLQNRGTKSYAWQTIRPHATTSKGDQRINSFGVGGEIEIRAGLLVQKQPIDSPVIHFGLGENASVDVARIIWPNGVMQAEFDLKSNSSVAAVQRLKGSCPWVFAWNGTRVDFVTDFIWRSPLGLKINAQDTGAVAMTEDWVRIRGDQLKPRDGYYDIRITADLWETHFFDQVTLMTVDHPAGTEALVDERFAIPPPRLGVTVTGSLHPVDRAVDDLGQDVGTVVKELDGSYLDSFERGKYQGVTRDHFVEVEIGPGTPQEKPHWLVGQGWIHPTDSSINVAMAQGNHPAPRGLSLEVADGKGGWVVTKPNLGFPAGKTKTILIDLQGVFRPGAPRRLRLRTNLEIYWDRLAWATDASSAQVKTSRILPESVDLRYRGFCAVSQPKYSSPELPDYNRLEGTTQKWIDLIGYCTRFGDVKELVKAVDDRYVIMNAGDEMVFRFPAAAPLAPGMVRDYVLIGDGWEKDGDLNTGFSKTVLPLPSHGNPMYNRPPGRLEDDPVYRRYPGDWLTYHTRYVTPDAFWSSLRAREGQ